MVTADDPPAVIVDNRGGHSPFLFIGDHAGDSIPQVLGTLGLGAADRQRHIALDIGTRALGIALANRLDTTFIHQAYSRLVIDCNRLPRSAGSILAASDGTAVPGNAGLDEAAIQSRIDEIHAPYHGAIAEMIAERSLAGRETILISLHSFTPAMGGKARPWPIGVLHGGGNTAFALALLAEFELHLAGPVGDNEPYCMDETDYSVPFHAVTNGLAYAEIEVRQDGLAGPVQIEQWSQRLATALLAAKARIDPHGRP